MMRERRLSFVFPAGMNFHGYLMSSRVGSFMVTLPETDIAPENGWLEDEISYWRGLFKGAMLVLGSVMVLK